MTRDIKRPVSIREKQIKSSKIQSWVPSKEILAHEFLENVGKYRNMPIHQGDIFFCEIGENVGEEQCNSRPVLVVSKSFYNHKSSQITIVPLSETVKTKIITRQGKKRTVMQTRTHYLLRKNDFNFLNADSAVKCEQIRSVSKTRLNYKLGEIDKVTLKRIQTRITDLLDL